jgi:hypothetical protein
MTKPKPVWPFPPRLLDYPSLPPASKFVRSKPVIPDVPAPF